LARMRLARPSVSRRLFRIDRKWLTYGQNHAHDLEQTSYQLVNPRGLHFA